MRLIRLLALVAAGALIVGACSGAATSPAPATAAPATGAPASASAAASAGGGSGNAVTIKDFAFAPAQLAATAGDVTWTNEDGTPHTVVSDDNKFQPSGNLTKGGAPFKVTLAAGTYPYHCGIHPTMKGTVTVS